MTTRQLSVVGALAVVTIFGAMALAGPESTAARSALRNKKLPGDNVDWIRFPPQNDEANSAWGDFLSDIACHLPSQYGDRYYSNDRITHAHETTHGINSHISNRLNHTGRPAYGFYVGHNRAVLLSGPRLKLSQVAAVIPQCLRGSRYQLYCIEQQRYFEDHPLYLFDEWVAYTNGAHAGVELAEKQQLDMPRNDALIGPMEFSIYALAIAAAAERHDPEYLRENKQFREFLAHELRRACRIYKKGIKLDQFRWERRLERNLLEEDDAQEIRQVVQQLYGDELTLAELLVE
jgi:hypothetical protein